MKVALGGIFTESNHLVGTLTGLGCFERTELRRGEALLASSDGVLGGALSQLRERSATILPAIFASAVPGGVVTLGCYEGLKAELLERLRASLPVDGVLLLQHGGAAVEELGDLDGDLIDAVRQAVGPAVPMVVTLDCHAHVTAKMVENANALVAWETYPHRDTFTTGVRGARILMDTLEGRVRPTMVMARVPVIASGYCGSTEEGPFADLMREAKALEGRDGVLSTSMFLVQPHLDLPEMGSGGLVITDNDAAKAERLATVLAERYWSRRFDLEPEIRTPQEAIAEGLRIPGTVLLLETSDCVGGGAAGDGSDVLRALLEANVDLPSLVPVVDPETAARCHEAGEGAEVQVTLGHKVDPRWGAPVAVTAQVVRLSGGRFVYSGGIWGGQEVSMGPSAWLRCGRVEILVESQGTYDWADEQFRSLGMDTENAKFIVVKNPMNYRVGYHGRFQAAFVLDTPGPTTAALRNVQYRRLARPYFPVDRDIAGLRPAILRGREVDAARNAAR